MVCLDSRDSILKIESLDENRWALTGKPLAAQEEAVFAYFSFPLLILQSLKEGLTAEQRLHLFDDKDTKEFWQGLFMFRGPLYFSSVITY